MIGSQNNRIWTNRIKTNQYVTHCPLTHCLQLAKLISMNTLEQLGRRIREKRHFLNLSQEKLAEKCDFDRTCISLLERGKRNPSYKNLLKLAKGLCISISELTVGLE